MAAFKTRKNEPRELIECKNECSATDQVSFSQKPFNFNLFDVVVLILSVFSIIVDLCTDFILVVQYSNQGFQAWAISTFVLIFLPSIIVQYFSLRWHIVDKTASVLHWVIHFCMFGIVHRYIQIIRAALVAYKSKKTSDIEKVLFDQSDLCMLHLFESFLESAPQLVLQMYVTVMLHEWRFWTGVSVIASLLSLAWALAAYTKAQRRARANKNSTTWPGLILQAVWRTGMLASRITTLVLGAYCFGNYFFLLITLHWIAMTTWIINQKTDFCETYWDEKIYNAVVGVIYCFCFFNLQEGQSRWRVLVFYLIIVFQNLICLTIFLMWFGEKTPKLAVSSFVAIVGGTILGTTSMLFYYRFFHPSGPIKFHFALQPTERPITPPPYSTMTLKSMKRNRPGSQIEKGSSDCNSPQNVNKSNLSDSVVVIEENVSDDSDAEIKKLQDWGNSPCNTSILPIVKTEKDLEKEAYKRRPICGTVDLVKLLEPKFENENIKLVDLDEASCALSAHDYENLCEVNIARETWGLRSWKGYSDIETSSHDDSIVHDRRLDTLTSTGSDVSTNTTQKENGRSRQDDYMEAIAEDLAQCESESTSDDIVQYSIETFPVSYPLGTLDPIFEELEEEIEETNPKVTTGSASTLVATIEEISRNTPIQNRYPTKNLYNGFLPLSKPRNQAMWRKVAFAPKLQTFPEGLNVDEKTSNVATSEKNEIVGNSKPEIDEIAESEDPKNGSCTSVLEISNKENIPTIAGKINLWNNILDNQKENVSSKKVITPPKKGLVREKKSLFSLRKVTPPSLPVFVRKKET